MDVHARLVVEKRSATIVALVMGAALYVGFGILDQYLFPENVSELRTIRAVVLAVLVPITVCVFAAWDWYRRNAQALLTAATLTAGSGILWMNYSVGRFPHGETYYAGLILVMTVQFVLLPLAWRWATASAVFFVLGYNATLLGQDISAAVVVGNNFFLAGAAIILAIGSYSMEQNARLRMEYEEKIESQKRDIEEQKARADSLLHQILPDPIADRLLDGNQSIADGYSDVTVLFADLAGFTEYSSSVSPRGLVRILNRVFSSFDQAAEDLGVEKIKTIGDAYMAACGLPDEVEDHPERMLRLAIRMREELEAVRAEFPGFDLKLRIGIHTGPCIAGVIGKQRLIYDLWGDTVNLASRMESAGLPGEIQVSEATWLRTRQTFRFEPRPGVKIKGRGELTAYVLLD